MPPSVQDGGMVCEGGYIAMRVTYDDQGPKEFAPRALTRNQYTVPGVSPLISILEESTDVAAYLQLLSIVGSPSQISIR